MFMPPQEVFLSSKPYFDYGLRANAVDCFIGSFVLYLKESLNREGAKIEKRPCFHNKKGRILRPEGKGR
jgi:hypothetical protein